MWVLCNGSDWRLPQDEATVEFFHGIARANGSQAVWLPVTGTVYTNDRSEIERDFPYASWRSEARAHADTMRQSAPPQDPPADNE